jgi:FkbM family methyltransferase
MEYLSQLGQDRFIDEFFKEKRNGVFVDIGAHEGVHISNTFFLEKERGWTGICIEPLPVEFKKLNENRNSINLNVGVSDFDGEADFTYIEGYANMLSGISEKHNQAHRERILNEVNHYGGKINNIKVPIRKLQGILDEHNSLDVDFCSIDTEGSEFNIVKSIDFSRTNIKVFIIENNYNETTIKEFLETKGYSLYKKLGWDDVFIKNELINNEQ